MSAIRSSAANALSGDITVPGDKSISHRALMLAGCAVGETRITGLLASEDILATAAAMEALGAEIERPAEQDGPWRVWGRGVGGLAAPGDVLDMGNSGTGARLLTGILASHPFTSVLTGDASLRSRPMARVTKPLERMGAQFICADGGRLPMTILGATDPRPIVETPSVASAQVKSAILLAGLNAPGKTTVIEHMPTRDHTERMMRAFGAEVVSEETSEGLAVTVTGRPEIGGIDVQVPADVSSAAFPLVAALIVPGSAITVRGAGINPLRAGLLNALDAMGADISVTPLETAPGGDPLADITAKTSALKGADIPPEWSASMIDEYPILAMAAAVADGSTRFNGVGELRVKESDRLAAVARGLDTCGVRIEEGEDFLVIHGTGGNVKGGATIAADLDHRIAMSFLVLGLAAKAPITIDDGATIATSFPGFADIMRSLGAVLEEGIEDL